ncbi:MAG: hypothetical protein DRP90_07185 [Planctomycetota bacterium]|nr:MAG: hypothetical protein DRP90_07185 [Planctomycetota bacterium]
MVRRLLIPAGWLFALSVFAGVIVCGQGTASAVLTLEVTSEHGAPQPSGVTEYEFGDEVSASVQEVIIVDVDTRIICTGWTGTGSVPATGDSNEVTFTIYVNSTLTWNWAYEYTLRIYNPAGVGSSNPPVGTYRFVEGTRVSGSIPAYVSGHIGVGFTGTGSAPATSDTPFFSFVIEEPSTVTWRWADAPISSVTYWGEPSTGLTIFGGRKYSRYLYDPITGVKRTFYYDPVRGDLMVAWFNGTVWNNVTIDAAGDVGKYLDAAVGADGVYHVAYQDTTNGALKYAWSADGFEWHTLVVDPYNNAGAGLDITLDADGEPWIAYFAPGLRALRVAHKENGEWKSPVVVDDDVSDSTFVSLAYNPLSGSFEVAYYDGALQRAKHAWPVEGGWTIEQIPAQNNSGLYMACAVNALGQPFFCYQEYAQAGRRDLKLTYKSADNWYYETLSTTGDTGYYNIIRFDANNYPVVYTLDLKGRRIRQYSWTGTKWVVVDVSGEVAFQPIELVTDNDGTPVICYYAEDTMMMRKPAEGGGTGNNGEVEATGGGGGCFIATAAFGSLAAAEVRSLTDLRDAAVLSSSTGGAMVGLYYAVSPGVAQAVRERPALRASLRRLLPAR